MSANTGTVSAAPNVCMTYMYITQFGTSTLTAKPEGIGKVSNNAMPTQLYVTVGSRSNRFSKSVTIFLDIWYNQGHYFPS